MAIKEILEGNTSKVLEATELLNELGDREGQFVWKKYEAKSGLTITATQLSTNPLVIQVESSDVNLSLTDEMFWDGVKFVWSDGNYWKVVNNDGVLSFQWTNGSNGNVSATASGSWNASTKQFSIVNGSGWGNPWTVTCPSSQMVFASNVVSDDATSYPNGSIADDGCYYVKLDTAVASGNLSADFGEITLTSSTATLTINHSLKVTPSAFAVWFKTATNDSGSSYRALVATYPSATSGKAFVTFTNSGGADDTGTITPTLSSTKVSLPSPTTHSNYWVKGTYKWCVLP